MLLNDVTKVHKGYTKGVLLSEKSIRSRVGIEQAHYETNDLAFIPALRIQYRLGVFPFA